MAAFSSSPSTPDVTEGGDACAFAGGPGSPIFVAEDAVAESGLFPLGRPISSIFFCRDDQDDLVPPCFFVRPAVVASLLEMRRVDRTTDTRSFSTSSRARQSRPSLF
jgi:hypothetical protein